MRLASAIFLLALVQALPGASPARAAAVALVLAVDVSESVSAERRVIDVSGDGMANFGTPPLAVRDALVKQGITINGLAILSEEPWLDDYYRQNVIGGPSAFVVVATSFDSFADAMLRKLVQEV